MSYGFSIGLGLMIVGRPAGGADVTAPTLVSSVINAAGTTWTDTYSESLDPLSVPAASAWVLSGTLAAVSGVSISGNTVIRTLTTAVLATDTVTASYTAGGSPVQDAAGNDAANYSGVSVTNNSTATSPNPITSGLILELDSSDSYLTYDGSDRISAWNDKSGAGNHGSTAAGFPLRVTGQLDGKNAVRFDATSVRIGRTALVGGARGAACTIILVAKKTGNTGAQIMCGQSATASIYTVRTDTLNWGIQQGSTQSEAGNHADTSWHTIIATFDVTDTLHVDDMTTPLVSANAGTSTADGWFLGRSSSGALFDCAAHLIYNRALTSGERSQIKTYLRAVYPSLPA